MKLLAPFVLVVAALFVSACSKSHDHSSHGGHVHKAPHGGVLIEAGDHQYNVELLRDTATGTLTAWILDGHAENFVRIAAASIEITTISGGQRRPLSLKPVANTATGETVGNTSQFQAQADWLKSGGEMAGTIEAVEIKGTAFKTLGFHLAK